jgi:hypothetical protein
VQVFDRDPELGVVYTGVSGMDKEGNILGRGQRRMVRGFVLPIAIRRTIPPFSSVLVRRGVFDTVGMFDESLPLAIDYDLWLRVAAVYRFDYVDEPLLLYRIGHANLSRRADERRRLVLSTILPTFLDNGGRQLLGRREIAEAYGDTYAQTGEALRSASPGKAIAWGCLACLTAPWMLYTWKTLARSCIPATLIRLSRNVCDRLFRRHF